MEKIRVMIVDDAVVVRRLITDALASDPEIEVVGTASNGRIALQRLEQFKPDIVTMDIEMPDMDGLTALTELRKTHPKLPVIMFSTLTERGGQATLEALARGATDYVTKPANVGSVTEGIARCREDLIPKIKWLTRRVALPGGGVPSLGGAGSQAGVGSQSAGSAAVAKAGATPAANAQPTAINPYSSGIRPPVAKARATPAAAHGFDALVIGISTGGPVALSKLMPEFPKDLSVPILIVQHMPPVFTRLLAERLTAGSQVEVVEGQAGMRVVPGKAYIAPGGFHMTVVRKGDGVYIETNTDAQENSCRPAVDVLFRSAAKAYGSRLLSAVLTGMGQDGMKGAESVREAGGRVIAQDEASCVVWGMPGAVVHAGLADEILPLDQIGQTVLRRLRPPAVATARLAVA